MVGMSRDWSASICLGSRVEREEEGVVVVGGVGEDVGEGVGESVGVVGVAGLVALTVVAAEEAVHKRKR